MRQEEDGKDSTRSRIVETASNIDTRIRIRKRTTKSSIRCERLHEAACRFERTNPLARAADSAQTSLKFTQRIYQA